MKILLLGNRGQLGRELESVLSAGRAEIGSLPACYTGAEMCGADLPEWDVTELGSVRELLGREKPEVVINCAGYTNVDGCETHEDQAFAANALGPRNVALACEQMGARLVHVSTDYVFAGDGTAPYGEEALPGPVSAYGRTKLAGEAYTRQFCPRSYIVRTAWLYGLYGKNFVDTILRAAEEKGCVRVVNDQFGNPTNANDLAYHLLKIAATEEYGVYHCTGNGICSWYDLAKAAVDLAGIDAQVTPCTTGEYGSPVKRPAYSALEHRMLRQTVGDEMRPWRAALESYITQWKAMRKGARNV